jgi:hypothetical protein
MLLLFAAHSFVSEVGIKSLDIQKYIQGDSGEKFTILGGDSIGHCEKKYVRMNVYLILNGYRNRAVSMYKYVYKTLRMVVRK